MIDVPGDIITGLQRDALAAAEQFDLSDGHPERDTFPNEDHVLGRIQEFYENVGDRSVIAVEGEFLEGFANFSEQTIDPARSFVFHSASNAISAAAMAVNMTPAHNRRKARQIQVVSPIIDNLPGLFSGANIDVQKVDESQLDDLSGFEETISRGGGKDALMLVSPNNPTGRTLSQIELRNIAETCKENGTTLILDTAFRMYKPGDMFDTAAVLDESGTSYMLINDTGKLWTLKGNKAGILTASEDMAETARRAHNTLQISSTAITMTMLTELMKLGGDLTKIRRLVIANRNVLRSVLASGTGVLEYPELETGLPVEMLKLAQGLDFDSRSVAEGLRTRLGVHTVPLSDFDIQPTVGVAEKNAGVRVSLSRDRSDFMQAAKRVARLTEAMLGQESRPAGAA